MVYGESVLVVEPGAELEEAKKKLRHLEALACNLRVESQVMEGDPVEMILRVAEKSHIDVIVMGPHGRRALARLLLGSVAEAVLRKASCPVLTAKVPARLKQSAKESETKKEAGVGAGADAD
jgi:nucleotide-binding universal stress UspA family protein